MVLLIGMMIALPGLIIPAIVGSYLWRSSSPGTFRRMIALFALKPWITTPLFLIVVALTAHLQQWIFPMLPGLIVTLILIGMFAASIRAHPVEALLMLGGDAARWALAAMTVTSDSVGFFPTSGAVLPTLIWTSLYALLCWELAERQAPRATPEAG